MGVVLLFALLVGGLVLVKAIIHLTRIRRIRTPAQQIFEPIAADDAALPCRLRRFFRELGEAVAPLGLEPLLCARRKAPASVDAQFYVAVFRNPKTHQWATGTASVCSLDSAHFISTETAFGAKFANGIRLIATTSWPILLDSSSDVVVRYFPELSNVTLLQRIHCAIAERELQASMVLHPSHGDALKCLQDDAQKAIDASLASGRLRRLDNACIGLTIKTAFLVLLTEIRLTRRLLRWRAVRRARKMLQRLGLSPHYEMATQAFVDPK